MNKVRIGIDLGGTKTEIIALDENGKALFRQRVATPKKDYQAILGMIGNLVHEAEHQIGTQGNVGIGTPGALSRASGKLRNSNTTCMNGKPLLQDLESLLNRKIRLSNDANCFALSEATDGSGVGAAVVFGVIIGTGTGAGIVVNGKVLDGPNAIAGEWGHNSIPWPREDELPGHKCYCGKRGCIETFLSGPGLARYHHDLHGKTLSADIIVNQALKGDQACILTMDRYEDRLARALAHVINILDPDVIVLGGGMSNIKQLYQNIPKLWGHYVFSDRVDTRLLPPKHGDSSGVRGAAWL